MAITTLLARVRGKDVLVSGPVGIAGVSDFAFSEFFEELAQDNIIAHAGGGQASATPITGQTARVTTVATIGDSVLLPPSKAGLEIVLINHGANDMQVFGAGADMIDDIAAATGVSQMANSFVIYSCVTAGRWYTEGLANGYAGGQQTVSNRDGIIAHAGGGQASATPLTKMQNRVATVATAGDSVLLMPSLPGMQITVINGSANSMNVFPQSGEAINALGANAAFAAAGLTVTIFFCTTAGQWWTK